MIILNVCVFLACTTCVPGVYGGQKRAWEPLELEFQRVQRIDLGRAVFLSTERTLQHQLTEVPYVNKVCWRNTCMWPSLTLADPCWREKLSHCIYNYLAFKISDFNMLNKNNKPLVIMECFNWEATKQECRQTLPGHNPHASGFLSLSNPQIMTKSSKSSWLHQTQKNIQLKEDKKS